MVRKYRAFSHEIATAIRFSSSKTPRVFALGKLSKDVISFVLTDLYANTFRVVRVSVCVCAPQFKCTIFISIRLAMKRKRYNQRYRIELYRLNLTTVVFISFSFFVHFCESRRCAFRSFGKISFLLRHRHKFSWISFSFLKFRRGKQANERAYNPLLPSTENWTEVLNFVCADLLVNQ